jgi:hypothetical protein
MYKNKTSIKGRKHKRRRVEETNFKSRWCQLLILSVLYFLRPFLLFPPVLFILKEEEEDSFCMVYRRQLGLHPRAPFQTGGSPGEL